MKAAEGTDNWKNKSLRDLATINYGRSPSNILSEDGPYPVVGTGGGERSGNSYLYEGESIILGRKGTIDRVYYTTGRFWTIDTAYYLSGFGDTVPRWLCYYLQTLDLRQMNEATGVPSLSRDLLYKIEIPTPPKPEQSKIAEILSTVDRAIEQTEALIAKQQRIKTGLMQDLLTRGIDEHGHLRSEHTHKFKDSPLGRVPEEWDVVPLLSFSSKSPDSFVNGPFGSDLLSSELQNEGVPVIYIRDIKPGAYQRVSTVHVTRTKADQLAACTVHYGDILVAKVGDPPCDAAPYTHRERAVVTQDVIRIRPSKDVVSSFLSHLLNSHVGRKAVKEIVIQGTRARVSLTEFKTLKLTKPPPEEQIVIADALESIHRDIQKRQSTLDKLKLLRTALMQDLLSGRKRVTSPLEKEVSTT
jgi:type I restriction enzyme, S subunit